MFLRSSPGPSHLVEAGYFSFSFSDYYLVDALNLKRETKGEMQAYYIISHFLVGSLAPQTLHVSFRQLVCTGN